MDVIDAAPPPPGKRPRGRPKIVKSDSGDARLPSPSGDSASESPVEFSAEFLQPPLSTKSSDSVKKKVSIKKTDKRPLVNKENLKLVDSHPFPAEEDANDTSAIGSLPTAFPEPPPSTSNPLKVRSISTGVFTQALLGILMTGPPLSMAEISKLIPNVTLDQLQGILDVIKLYLYVSVLYLLLCSLCCGNRHCKCSV